MRFRLSGKVRNEAFAGVRIVIEIGGTRLYKQARL